LDFLLGILFSSRFFKFPADLLDVQRKIWIFCWKIYFPGAFLIFRLNFEISGGIFRVPLEIWIFRAKFYFPADFLNFPQLFWISSGIAFDLSLSEKMGVGPIYIGPTPLRGDLS
jgi:hypothetical protein